ncbi:MAG: type 1 glutamine amidotransferase domain-containing protein [Gammaproteobacteria bacterium]
MKNLLQGRRIAILVADGFEESEMTSPREVLSKAGAEVVLITPDAEKVRSWQHGRWGKYFKVNGSLKDFSPKEFDGIILPGGVMNPDKLRINKKAIKFIQHFVDSNKPIASICHGPWVLVETGRLEGAAVTSYHSIKSDLINAGAKWENKKVVRDGNLVTSRTPNDLPSFNKEAIKLFMGIV